jgi:tetratricopeptide (TPR) repeat protein
VMPLAVPTQPERAGLADVEMSDAEAVFIAAARRHDHRFALDRQAAPTLARICVQLDGLPLALELAAARTPYLTLEALAAGLQSTMQKSRAAPRDNPPRHHTVEATVDWSFRLLDREQRRAFTRFSVFSGGATFEDAIDVTGADRPMLEALVDKSLLQRRRGPDGTIRLSMLETIRAHAARRLDSGADGDAVRERHLRMAVALTQRECPRLRTHDGRDALMLLDVEIDNLRAALQWAIEARPAAAVKLVGLLAEYWWIRTDFSGLSWLSAVLEAVGDSVSSPDYARAVFHHAIQLGFRDQGDAALAGLHRALALFRDAEDHVGAAEVLCSLAGGVGVFADDREAERAYAEQALGEARLVGDDALTGRALARLAPCLSADEREVTLSHAAELLERVGDHAELASAYNNTAYQLLREGQPEQADRLADVALGAADRVAHAWNMIVIHGTAGLTKVILGDHQAAREHLVRQLELSREHGLRHNGEGIVGLAVIEVRRGRYDAAARLLGIARHLGYPPTKHDVVISELLERDFFVPAMRVHGQARWRSGEQLGAAMSYEDAIAYALGETGVDDAITPPATRIIVPSPRATRAGDGS